MNKKVLIISSSLQSGGAERVAANLAMGFNKKGYKTTLLVGKSKETDFYDLEPGTRTIYQNFDYEKVSGLGKLKRFVHRCINTRKIIKNEKPDIVICMKWEVSFRAAFSTLFMKTNLIFSEHNHYYALKSKSLRISRNLLYYIMPKNITVLTSRDINSYPSLLKSKIVVMPNPLGLEISDSNYLSLKNKSNSNKNEINLLAIGRMTEQKGFDRLINIFSRYTEQSHTESVKLFIAGDGKDLDKLKLQSKKLGLMNNVVFLGQVKNISEIYANSDIFLMTSRWEGLPMVLGEAMNFGIPIVAFDCPTGPREFISDHQTGYLVKNSDDKDFVGKLDRLIVDEDIRKNMSYQSRKSSKNWSIENVITKWLHLIND